MRKIVFDISKSGSWIAVIKSKINEGDLIEFSFGDRKAVFKAVIGTMRCNECPVRVLADKSGSDCCEALVFIPGYLSGSLPCGSSVLASWNTGSDSSDYNIKYIDIDALLEDL